MISRFVLNSFILVCDLLGCETSIFVCVCLNVYHSNEILLFSFLIRVPGNDAAFFICSFLLNAIVCTFSWRINVYKKVDLYALTKILLNFWKLVLAVLHTDTIFINIQYIWYFFGIEHICHFLYLCHFWYNFPIKCRFASNFVKIILEIWK